MKAVLKRIRFTYQTKPDDYETLWQMIDPERMITLEDVWNFLRARLSFQESPSDYLFYSKNKKCHLPKWFHVDLLDDDDLISVESSKIREPMETISPPKRSSIKLQSIKQISKKKQLKTSVTNRSFIITNSNELGRTFLDLWNLGIRNMETKTAVFVY